MSKAKERVRPKVRTASTPKTVEVPKVSVPTVDPVAFDALTSTSEAKPPKVDGKPYTENPQPQAREAWHERHKRVTFHCPIELLELLQERTTTNPHGRDGKPTRTAFIVNALQSALSK